MKPTFQTYSSHLHFSETPTTCVIICFLFSDDPKAVVANLTVSKIFVQNMKVWNEEVEMHVIWFLLRHVIMRHLNDFFNSVRKQSSTLSRTWSSTCLRDCTMPTIGVLKTSTCWWRGSGMWPGTVTELLQQLHLIFSLNFTISKV